MHSVAGPVLTVLVGVRIRTMKRQSKQFLPKLTGEDRIAIPTLDAVIAGTGHLPSTNQLSSQSMKQGMNQSIHQSINQSIKSITRSTKPQQPHLSIHLSTNHRSVNQSINQPTNQSIHPSIYLPSTASGADSLWLHTAHRVLSPSS